MLKHLSATLICVSLSFMGCATLAGFEEDVSEVRQELVQDLVEADGMLQRGEITVEEWIELREQSKELAKDDLTEAVDAARDTFVEDIEKSKERGKGILFSLSELILMVLTGSAGVGGAAFVAGSKKNK